MRLRTKLVLTATGLTFTLVLVLSTVFLGELVHQRTENTYTANNVLARQVLLATRQAVETGLRAHPPVAPIPDATNSEASDPEAPLHTAVMEALRSNEDLLSLMNGIVRYSPTVEEVSITDAHGFTMVSTDPDALNQHAAWRESFDQVLTGTFFYQMREVFGKPRVLDIAVPLDRNHMPFLVIHVGVRSTFLRFNGENAYEPWLRAALEFVLIAILASALIAALLSAVALRPLQAIGEQLERLTLAPGNSPADPLADQPPLLESQAGRSVDPVNRVNLTIDRLGRQMRTREEGYTALQTNLDQMLDTLRDGVLLFAPDRRAVMVSDAVAQFFAPQVSAVNDMVGMRLEKIFLPETTLGAAVAAAFERGAQSSAETITLEDGRQVQISLDRIDEGRANGNGVRDQSMGTLLTLRDTGSALELEQELEVARRLAAIGRLTTNVGHEVKNPINAMVVHLELLRGKLANEVFDKGSAQRHVEILAGEMQRLDRVVETLADFSRPMDLDLRELDLRRVIDQTLDLAGAELKEHSVAIESQSPPYEVPVRIDAELMRQALLNLLLNAMQAMPSGGVVRISVRRDQRLAFVEIADNGEGIPASVLPRIFDLYFTTKPKGSGIGLAMTYRILQLHGGALDVRSDADPASPEHGTVFTLRIPISLNLTNEGRRQQPRIATGKDLNDPIAKEEDMPASVASTMDRKEPV
ncbi:MAG: ATP-binding protein [Acidobacteriota bacterium]|nr:ATP-binding protein [Acidobacteriota bacterium]